jgi:glycosyltransferase involved in cell wall biosynthesis
VRIAFATHAYAPAIGGAERYAQGLAEAIASDGHDVHVVTPDADSAEVFYEFGHMGPSTASEIYNGVHIHRVPISYPHRPLMRPPASGPIPVEKAHLMWEHFGVALRSEIRTINPDAVVALPHAFPNVQSIFAPSTFFPVAYAPLLHEHDPAWNAAAIGRYVAKADIALALSEWERGRLVEAYGSLPDSTVLVPPSSSAPNPQDVEVWESANPYVVSVGRRTASKNLPVTSKVVAQMRRDGVDLKHVVIGPPGDRQADDALADFREGTELVGEVDEQSKWSIIKGAIATVSMSDRESFGIATLESWRMGVPAVSRRIPVMEELIQDGETGLLVHDAKELHFALTTLMEQPHLADAIGEAGREFGERFSWQASAEALVQAL